MPPHSEPTVSVKLKPLEHPPNLTLLSQIKTLEILRKVNQNGKKLETITELLDMLYQSELTLTSPATDQDSTWDSFFSAILQNVLDNYSPDEMQELIPALSFSTKGNKKISIQLDVLFNKTKRSCPHIDSKKSLFENPAFAEALTTVVEFFRSKMSVQINVWSFEWKTWTIKQLTPNQDAQNDFDQIDIILAMDSEQDVIRSVIPLHKLHNSNLIEYSEALLDYLVQRQEMTLVLTESFNKIESEEFQKIVEKHLKTLKEKVTKISEFRTQLFQKEELNNLPSLEFLSKYENSILEQGDEDDAIGKILQQLKQQFVHSMNNASQSVLMARLAEHKEKIRLIQEREEQLVVENDRLEQVIEESEATKKQKEEELRKLEIELKNAKTDKKRLEDLIAKKKAELEDTARKLKAHKESMAWNAFKKDLMELQVSYDNLKRGSDLGDLTQTTLTSGCQKILDKFPLPSFKNNQMIKQDLYGFTNRSDGTNNRREIASLLKFLYDPPIISFNTEKKDIIEVKGRQVLLSQVLGKVAGHRFSEIRIIAGTVLYLDEDMPNGVYHGRNVVLTAPLIEVVKSMTINTSGLDGNPKSIPAKASDGAGPGRNGVDGSDGQAGESAGHVFIQGGQINNSERLTVLASGGNGGHGSDGGHGINGYDGTKGRDGDVGDGYSWAGWYHYKIERGTDGTQGGRGGSGGNAGLGGGPGAKGDVTIAPSGCKITVKSTPGKIGRDGKQGMGGRGGSGGYNGVDHAVAWHNQAFAGGYFIYKRGKLSLSKQYVWYGGNGWDIHVHRSEWDVRNSRAMNGEHGHNGQSAANRANARKQATTKSKVSESEVTALSLSVQSQYTHSSLGAEKSTAATLAQQKKAIEAQESQLNKDKRAAEDSKRKVEEAIKQTEATIKKTEAEKAALEALIAKSGAEIEANKIELQKVAELLKEQMASLAVVTATEEASQNVAQVIQNHQREENAEALEQHRQNQVNRLQEFDSNQIKDADSKLTNSEVKSQELEEKERMQGLYDEVRGVQNLDRLSDEFFAIALASRVQDPELSSSIEIGLEAIKAASTDGNKLPEFTRAFLETQCSKLATNFVAKTPLSTKYLREQLPQDTLVASAVHSWTDKNPELLHKIQKAIGGHFEGTEISQYFINFRTSQNFKKARNIDKVHKAIEELRVKKKLDNPEGHIVIDHLEQILITHMQTWFMEQCKGESLSEEAIQKIETLLSIVNKIYSEVKCFIQDLSLYQTYKDFLTIVRKFKTELDQNKLWESFVLQLTGVSSSSSNSSTLLAVDKTFKNLTNMIKDPDKNSLEIQRHLNILKYVIPRLEFQPSDLDHLQDNWLNLCSLVPTAAAYKTTQNSVLQLRQAISYNYMKNHQVVKIQLINTYLKDTLNWKEERMQEEILNSLSILISGVEGPFKHLSFVERLVIYEKFHYVLTEKTESVLEKESFLKSLNQLQSSQNVIPIDNLCSEFEKCIKTFVEGSSRTKDATILETYDKLYKLCHNLYQKVSQDTKTEARLNTLEKINYLISSFFIRFATNLDQCPYLLTQLINTFQSILIDDWRECLNSLFTDLIQQLTDKSETLDAKIAEILESIRGIVENSNEVLNREEFLIMVKVHLLKIVNGYQIFEPPSSSHEKALNVLKEISAKSADKTMSPLLFVQQIGSTLNNATTSIPFLIKTSIEQIQNTLEEFNKNPTSTDTCRNLLESCLKLTEADAIVDVLTQITSIRVHCAAMSLEMFGVEGTQTKVEFQPIYNLMEKTFSSNDDLALAIQPSLQNLGEVLSATEVNDCFTICRFIKEARTDLWTRFHKNVTEHQSISLDALENIFDVWTESDGDILTYVVPVNYFVSQIRKEIIPKIDASNQQLKSTVENLYLESCIKYFSLRSIPTLPTEIRAAMFNLTNGRNAFRSVFEAFESALNGQTSVNWVLPFLSIFNEFLRLAPANFPTSCSEIRQLYQKASKILDNGFKDMRISEKLQIIIDQLILFSGEVCRTSTVRKSKTVESSIKFIQTVEFAFWAGFDKNEDTFERSFLTKIYLTIETDTGEFEELKIKISRLFKQKLSKYCKSFNENIQTTSKDMKAALANFILNCDLNPLEVSVYKRIFNNQQSFTWVPTETQKEKFKFINQETNQASETNRFMQILLTDLKVKDKRIDLGFLQDNEQSALDSIMKLVTVDEYDRVLKDISEILEKNLAEEWIPRFKDLFLDAQFRHIVSLYENPIKSNFGGLDWKLPSQDTNNNPNEHNPLEILITNFEKEFQTFVSSHYENNLNIDSILLMSRELDINHKPKESIKAYIEGIVKLKHLYNRCHYFHQSSPKISEWLSLLYQRCKLRKPHLTELNDLLLRSVELNPNVLIRIAHETTFDTWMETILSRIVVQNVESLQSKIVQSASKSNVGQLFEDEVQITSTQIHKNLNACKSGFWKNRLLATLADKLQEEVQCASESMPMDLKVLEKVFKTVALEPKVDKPLVLDLMKHPLNRWTKIFKEHQLLKSYDKLTTNVILKFDERYGTVSTTRILKVLELNKPEIMKFVGNFNRLFWQFNITLLDKMEQVSELGPPERLGKLTQICQKFSEDFKNKKRDAKEISLLMAEDSKNDCIAKYLKLNPVSKEPNAPLEEQCKLERLVDKIKLTVKSKLVPQIESPIADWTYEEIKKWTEVIKTPERQKRLSNIEENISEVLKVICRALEIFKGYGPRDTQLIAVILLIDHSFKQKGCLAEVATGEGKTFIVAMAVISRALCGDDVDVITSSPILAEENLAEVVDLYAIFGITATCNCDQACEKEEKIRKDRYQKTVIYGDVGSFQRDVLLTDFFDKGITMNRKAHTVIVDEVDSMLLDKGENVLYLSHAIPELKFLWPLFIEIWQAVHAPDVAFGSNQDIYTVVRFIKERLKAGEDLVFPNCMSSFIQARLTPWVQNAFLAKKIQEKDSYLVANYEKKGHRVVIMDKDTGVEQMSMNWSNGLHQFIQLKHSDKLSSESLKAVFMSNICYFRSFQGRLFGITGTLGSSVERDLLSQCYSVDFFQIPRFKARRCYEEESHIEQTKEEWLQKIQSVVKDNVGNGRAVLIISENIDMVETIGNRLKSTYNKDKVYAYQSSFDKDFKKRREAGPLTAGDVIVATNIAGRGTDLKTDSNLEIAGGLHVILSYMPSNVRIEEQAFGRTARAGLSGTVQYIVHYETDSTNESVDTLRRQRDEQESHRLHDFRLKSIPRIEVEEKLCQRFNSLLQQVKKNLESMTKALVDLHVENLKNKWALWLDSIGEKVRLVHISGETPILQAFDKFEEEMLQKSGVGSSEYFETGPVELTKLGKYHEDDDNVSLALQYFSKAIEKEPYYSEIAHYYKAACIIKQTDSGINSKREAIKHLKISEKLIKKRMNLLFASSQTLQMTEDLRRAGGEGTLANRYESQVKNESELLQVHLGKIDEAIGSVISGQVFSGVKGVMDEAEGDAMFQIILRHTNILKNFRLSKKINLDLSKQALRIPRAELQGQWDEIKWPGTFKYCENEVIQHVKNKLNSGQRNLEEKDLEQFILTQNKLWDILKSNGLITDLPTEQVNIVNFSSPEIKEEFDKIDFGQDIVDHKSGIKRSLEENESKVYDEDAIFENLEFAPAQIQHIESKLKTAKIIQDTKRFGAKVSQVLKWNSTLKKWIGIPETLKKYAEIIEGVIEENSETGPVLKESILLNEIPLPETAEDGSKQLFAFFHQSGLIKEPKIRFNVNIADDQGRIDDRISEIEKALKASDELKPKLKKDGPTVDDIMDTMRKAIGKIKTIPTIEVSYEELSEYFKTGDYPPEIEEFRDKMFFHCLEVTEKKSWWDWGAFIVAMLGIAQIIAGVLLEVFTAGAATHLAMALISEGIGDIAFAIEAGINKSFSWKEYGIQKAISIAISIVTAGVGAWLSRGAQVARFGTKTGFQLFKAVGKRILKKSIEAVAFALSDIGIEKLLDYIRQEILNSSRGTLIEEIDKRYGGLEELNRTMDLIYANSYENGQAEKVIQDTFATVMTNAKEGTVGTEIHKHSSKIASEVASQMGTAGKKMFKHGTAQVQSLNVGGSNMISKGEKIAKLAKHVSKIVKVASVLKALCEMAAYCSTILVQFILKLKAKAVELKNNGKNSKNPTKSPQSNFNKFKSNQTLSVKKDILDYMMSQVQKSMVQPAFNHLTHKALTMAGKAMSTKTKSMLKSLGKDKNIQILAEYQNKQLRRSNARREIKDNFDVRIQPDELDPDTEVKTSSGEKATVADATKMYGDSLQLYQDKRGDIYLERPPFEQYVKTFAEGKTAGVFELMICAKFLKTNISIEDTTGTLQSADGGPTVIEGGGRKNGQTMQLVYTKNPDGTCFFNPKINGEVIEFSQVTGTTSLYQSLNLLQKMKGQTSSEGDFSIPSKYMTDFPTDFVSDIRNHALKSASMKSLYSKNIQELTYNFEVGVPKQKSVTTTQAIREMTLASGTKLTRSQSLLVKSTIENDRTLGKIRRAATLPANFNLISDTNLLTNNSSLLLTEDVAGSSNVGLTRSKTNSVLNKSNSTSAEGFVASGKQVVRSNSSNLLLLQEFKVRPNKSSSLMTREEFFVWFNQGCSSLLVQEFKVSREDR